MGLIAKSLSPETSPESYEAGLPESEEFLILMSAVDSAYEAGCFALAEELEVVLNTAS